MTEADKKICVIAERLNQLIDYLDYYWNDYCIPVPPAFPEKILISQLLADKEIKITKQKDIVVTLNGDNFISLNNIISLLENRISCLHEFTPSTLSAEKIRIGNEAISEELSRLVRYLKDGGWPRDI